MENLLIQNQYNRCVYILRKLDIQLAPIVIGLVPGPPIEKHIRKGLFKCSDIKKLRIFVGLEYR